MVNMNASVIIQSDSALPSKTGMTAVSCFAAVHQNKYTKSSTQHGGSPYVRPSRQHTVALNVAALPFLGREACGEPFGDPPPGHGTQSVQGETQSQLFGSVPSLHSTLHLSTLDGASRSILSPVLTKMQRATLRYLTVPVGTRCFV